MPRSTWPRGIIESAFPGRDGQTLVVKVKTSMGMFVRYIVISESNEASQNGVAFGAASVRIGRGRNVDDGSLRSRVMLLTARCKKQS